jgi:hypothetical protein
MPYPTVYYSPFDPEPHELDVEIVKYMRLPRSLWQASLEALPDQVRGPTHDYLKSLRENLEDGIGMLFYGESCQGKSKAAAVVLKAYREHSISCLWLQWSEIDAGIRSKQIYDGSPSLWDRIQNVPVLCIDAVPSKIFDGCGFSEDVLQDLVSSRCDNNLLVILNTRRYKPSYPKFNGKSVCAIEPIQTESVSESSTLPINPKKRSMILGAK